MKSFLVLWILCIAGTAGAQQPKDQIHPHPSDVMNAFQSISVVLGQIDSPLSVLASHFDSEQIATSMLQNRTQIRELTSKWASIINVSNGRVLPGASDLFTIYTEMLDIQSYSNDLTREDRLNGDAATFAQNAVVIIRGQTELLPVIETLKYAVADKIDAEEAACLKKTGAKKR
jgi:hypothetical protein